jgi:hypothetical protein
VSLSRQAADVITHIICSIILLLPLEHLKIGEDGIKELGTCWNTFVRLPFATTTLVHGTTSSKSWCCNVPLMTEQDVLTSSAGNEQFSPALKVTAKICN